MYLRWIRWILVLPVTMFAGFATVTLANNLVDWLTGGWPGIATRFTLPYTLGDLLWPIIAIVIGASVAPARRTLVAGILAIASIGSALIVGGSWSLNWLSDVPLTAMRVGLGVTLIGSVLGVVAIRSLDRPVKHAATS